MTREEIENIPKNINTLLSLSVTMHTRQKLDERLNKVCELAIKALEQELKTNWIPVSERLPEKNGRYLVTRGLNAIGALWNRVYIVNFSDLMGIRSTKIFWIGNVGKSDFEHLEDVIAWMPLPEPYEESEG